MERATGLVISALSDEINTQAPKVKKSIKLTKHIVVNTEIKTARRRKRRAERKFKKTRSESDKEILKVAKKELNNIVTTSTF